MQKLKLMNVYKTKRAEEILFQLLKERENIVNISHRRMPTFVQHCKFVRKKPYKAWYLIYSAPGVCAGGVYISKNCEVGLFIFKKFRGKGFGQRALRLLLKKYKNKRHFIANINPKNTPSINFFKKNGFRHIQNTYEFNLN